MSLRGKDKANHPRRAQKEQRRFRALRFAVKLSVSWETVSGVRTAKMHLRILCNITIVGHRHERGSNNSSFGFERNETQLQF